MLNIAPLSIAQYVEIIMHVRVVKLQECDICGSSILVKAVSTDSGVSNLCWRHRVANACTIQVE
jgi:DNA-directed RNA polymerase subunit RPC12/RpoP